MMFKKAMLLAVIAAGAVSMPVQAAQFNFTFVTNQPLFGGSVTGSGVFTTADTATSVGGQMALRILSITGMVNGSAIVAPTLAGGYGNYFITGPYFLDGSGTNFTTAAGNTIAFFNQSTNNLYRVNTFSPGSSSYVAVTTSAVAAVPEPLSWAMFIGGFALVGGALRVRRHSVAFA